MAKRRMAVIVFMLCLCLGFIPCYAKAASTTDVVEPIDLEQDCVLTLSYTCEGMAFSDVAVKLYKIAEVNSDFQYQLTSSFAHSNLSINGIQSVSEWNAIRSTLEAYIIADNVEAYGVSITNSNGQVCFEGLKPGLYLAIADEVMQEERNCIYDSVLVSMPSLDVNGVWQYQVSALPKAERIPPIESDEKKELKVVKLWKGDEGRGDRPKSVEVEIFCNGTSYKKIVLSKENNWSYSWETKEESAKWTVIERNTSSKYTMTVEKRDTSFVLTNTYTPENPFKDPQTGDTSNIMLYVILMIISGSMLIFVGVMGKRDAHEEIR